MNILLVLALGAGAVFSCFQMQNASRRADRLEAKIAELEARSLVPDPPNNLEQPDADSTKPTAEIYKLRAIASSVYGMQNELKTLKSENDVLRAENDRLKLAEKTAQICRNENWILKAYARTQTFAYSQLFSRVSGTNISPSQLMGPDIAESVEQRYNFSEMLERLREGVTDDELGRDYGMSSKHPEYQRWLKESGNKEFLIDP